MLYFVAGKLRFPHTWGSTENSEEPAEFIKDACAGRKIPFEIIDLRDGMIPHFKSVLGDESFDFYQNFSGNEAVANFSCQLT